MTQQKTPNDKKPDSRTLKRRDVIKGMAALGAVGALSQGVPARANVQNRATMIDGYSAGLNVPGIEQIEKKIPHGKIGGLDVSRVFLGFNVFKGHAHSRDLTYVRSLMRAYNTEERIYSTWRLAEAAGINALMLDNSEFGPLDKYKREYGGKMKSFVFNFPNSQRDHWKLQVDTSMKKGADTIFICGASTDVLVQESKYDLIQQVLEYIGKQGVPTGLAAHSITSLVQCDAIGIEPDYYLKSFHHDQYWSALPRRHRVDFTVDREKFPDHNKFHDNMFCLFPEKTVEFVRHLKKPFVAFKVFAAGAIDPESGLSWAFDNGADFVCAGMLDFQIAQDINISHKAISKAQNRPRPWYG